MVTLRSRKLLTCFYCGRKSNLRFEGQESFECSNCEAKNWLDEHGEITDPPSTSPASGERQVQYAIPRSSTVRSPSPSIAQDASRPDDSIFCAKCVRNQHMLNSSLAQFEWPDEASDAEYAAREKKYWALRKDLEKRYPQVCSECEPKVEKRIRDASYTAQTDHLRRMMNRTRTRRKEVKRLGPLDILDATGKWSWHLCFVLQTIWHLAVLYSLVVERLSPEQDGLWLLKMLEMCRGFIPEQFQRDRLMHWAINLGMCSFLWNPRFKQMIRGFTAHILGFSQWYTYQLLILLIRFVCLSVARYSKSKGLPPTTQLGAQVVVALLTIHVYRVARKSIHTDITPLFRPTTQRSSPQQSPATISSRKDPNDLGHILDEILDTPSKPNQTTEHNIAPGAHSADNNIASNRLANGSGNRLIKNHSSARSFESLNLSDPEPGINNQSQVPQYAEEMDWSPSASQHRAFSSYNPYKVKNTNPRFSDTPIEPKPGPIWYKVPPAPTNPAQRLRNPPMRPIIRESPKEKKENFFQAGTKGPVRMGSSNPVDSSGINFAEPKFYAPLPKDDPRDGLSNMFASSFNISPSPEDEAFGTAESNARTNSRLGPRRGTGSAQSQSVARIGELVVLLTALCCWIYALGTEEIYGPPVALASICACLIVSIRLAADLQVEAKLSGEAYSILRPSLATLALAQVVAALFLMWNVWSGDGTWSFHGTFGNALFGGMIVHHMWHILV